MTMTVARPMRVPTRALQNRFRTTIAPPTDSVGVMRITKEGACVRLDPRDEVFGRKGTERGEAALTALLRVFWQRGVALQVDPNVLKHHGSIATWHWSGSHQGVRYRIQSGIALDVHAEADVDPQSRKDVPYTVRSRVLVAITTGARALMALGYAAPVELRGVPLTAWAIGQYIARPAYPRDVTNGHHYFDGRGDDRDANGWPGIDALARHFGGTAVVTDADGVRLTQGAIRYAYDHHGHLVRGAVHGGINGQWMLLPDPTRKGADATPLTVTTALWYGAARHLFSWPADRTPVRHRALDAKGREERLARETRKAIDAKDYRRVTILAGELRRRFPAPPLLDAAAGPAAR